MKCEVKNFENKKLGEIALSPEVFGLPVRRDILARMVNYQLAKRRAGTHQTRTISMISGTTRKPWKQKGTGRARQGSLRSPQFRGGACIFGPVSRDHSIGLPKKVRRLALKTALSTKLAEGKLVIFENFDRKSSKTKDLAADMAALGFGKTLFIDGATVTENMAMAAQNIHTVDVLPQQGINVYDILRCDVLVLAKAAVENLEERLK